MWRSIETLGVEVVPSLTVMPSPASIPVKSPPASSTQTTLATPSPAAFVVT